MIDVIRDSCIRIPIEQGKGKVWFEQVVKDLRREEEAYNAEEGDPKVTKYYYDKDMVRGHLMIPRSYPLRRIPCNVKEGVITEGEQIHVRSKIKPRNARQAEAMNYIVSNNDGIICLSPGEGKTVISIESICRIGRKAIIFVHKDSLADQWIERFIEHTNLTNKDIGRLTTSKLEDGLFNYPIVISTVQTFCSVVKRRDDFYDLIRQANFGVAFWDECHTAIGAEQFSKTSLHLPCRRTYGLSATPKRSDGNTDIMHWHLGPMYVPKAEGIDTMKPKIVLIMFDHGVMKSKKSAWVFHMTSYEKNKRKKNGRDAQPKFDMTRYLTQLEKSKTYKDKIRLIMNQVSKSNRTALFLSARIKLLDEAAKGCVDKSQVGFFIPRSGEERDEHLKRKIVFSTYGSARDGTDKKELDCLILSTPTSNLEQAVGRVIRSCDGKQQPVVMDFVDTSDELFIDRAKRRIGFYQSKGWEIEERTLK